MSTKLAEDELLCSMYDMNSCSLDSVIEEAQKCNIILSTFTKRHIFIYICPFTHDNSVIDRNIIFSVGND